MPTISCGPTATGRRRTATALRIASAQKPPSTTVIATTSGSEVWYGAGALSKSVGEADPERDQARDGERAVARDVRVDRRAAPTPSSTSTSPAHEIGSTEKPKSAVEQRDRAERARQDDARVEDLEADPGEPGEEEQA